MRKCNFCGDEKEWSEFNKSSKGMNGYSAICRECTKVKSAEYRARKSTKEKNHKYHRSEEYRERSRIRSWSGKVGISLVSKEIERRNNRYIASFKYISKNEAIEFGLSRYFEGMECKRGHISERQTANGMCLECMREKSRSKDSIKKSREYYKNNKESLDEKARERYRDRYRSSPEFKSACAARNMLKRAMSLTGHQKHCSTFKEIGYSKEELMRNLESKFEQWMSWDNFGEWHIDHVIPVSHLVKIGIKSPKAINCLDNLSPISREENMSKRCKLPKKSLYDKIMKTIEEINNETYSN